MPVPLSRRPSILCVVVGDPFWTDKLRRGSINHNLPWAQFHESMLMILRQLCCIAYTIFWLYGVKDAIYLCCVRVRLHRSKCSISQCLVFLHETVWCNALRFFVDLNKNVLIRDLFDGWFRQCSYNSEAYVTQMFWRKFNNQLVWELWFIKFKI